VKRALIVIVLLAGVAGAHWLLSRNKTGTPVVSGTVETDEAHVASRYGGRVVALFAEEGDTLTNGQPIATLDAPELPTRRDQAAAALLELVNGPRTNEIATARHELELVKAQLSLAVIESKRAIELYEKNVAPVDDRDKAVSRVETLQAQARSVESRLSLLLEGTRPETIANARARLAEIDTQLREMRVVAPSDCTLEVLSVRVGDVLAPNREVATLLLKGHLWVRVYVSELWLSHIKLGDKVRVRADGHDREFEGVVEQINRQAEFTPRNVQTAEDRIRQLFGVKIRLPHDTGILKPGMSVDAFFANVPPPPPPK
jgi:HlyD family secretion protein